MPRTKWSFPIFASLKDAGYELGGMSEDQVRELVRDGELEAVVVRGQTMVVFDSIIAFARRTRDRARRAEARS